MKLSKLADGLFRQISREEHDLELPIVSLRANVRLKRGKEIIIHDWEYKAKEVIDV